MQLGDAVHEAIDAAVRLAGADRYRVGRWLREPCGGCEERRRRLNALGAWAARVLRGRADRAREHLDRIMGEGEDR